MMKLVFKSDNCSDVLSACLPHTFEDMKACLHYLNLASAAFSDGYKWHIVYNNEIVCLVLGTEVLCKYAKED